MPSAVPLLAHEVVQRARVVVGEVPLPLAGVETLQLRRTPAAYCEPLAGGGAPVRAWHRSAASVHRR